MTKTHHAGKVKPLSSRNLVRNGGAALNDTGGLVHWEDLSTGKEAWRRVPVPDFDPAGLPHSTHAIELVSDSQRCAGLRQQLRIDANMMHHFAFRLTARRHTGNPECEIVVMARPVDGPPRHVARFKVKPSPDWARYRFVFDLTKLDRSSPLYLEVRASRDHGSSRAWITDLRLVALYEERPRFAVRFDTRGSFLLPSSRLRAFMIEDYLNLLGWQTSINAGSKYDLLVCQKVRPWASLLNVRLRRRCVIYDLDDNELVQSFLLDLSIRAFSRLVDGTTTGGEFLHAMLSKLNKHAFLFDNTADILDRDIVRSKRKFCNRLVWFGMQHNAWEVDKLTIPHPITKITHRGDIEYQVKTIDAHLVDFDLALLPVSLNAYTRAKNANRLVKCVALGLPFLASDTPEHRRALARLGMSESMLVKSGDDWSGRILDIGDHYNAYVHEIEAARQSVFEVYGVEHIAAEWIDYCSGLLNPDRK